MSRGLKRQLSLEDGGGNSLPSFVEEIEPTSERPYKKLRKETNASARRSLFIRSLPATVTSSALTELFSQNYPLKHATVVLDPETKQSKGYGFVTLADAEDAERAKEEFHGQLFEGRKLKVEIAEPRHREITKNGAGGKISSISSDAAVKKKARSELMAQARKPPKLIIRNLPWSIDDSEKLATLFRPFGKVKFSTLPKVKNKQAGFGFVVMRGRNNAEKALEAVNGKMVDGRTIAVDWAVEKEVWETRHEGIVVDEGGDHLIIDDNTNEDSANPIDTNADVENFMKNHFEELEEEDEDDADAEGEIDDSEVDDDLEEDTEVDEAMEKIKESKFITDNSSTLFIRNLPFTVLDPDLKEHFEQFGPVRYARVVVDRNTERPKGTGFVCFFNLEDADKCFREAPRYQPTGANAIKKGDGTGVKHSILQDENFGIGGLYSIQGRVLQLARAVDRNQATKFTEEGTNFRDNRDKDKRRLYLLSEGTVAAGTPLHDMLAPSEVEMREDSAMQRKKLIQNNASLHLSLTRLSIRNIPRNFTSKDLKALAREGVVGFAKDVKSGIRAQLSKEEEARGGATMREADRERKLKGKGIVKQSKIVFEGREGAKVSEESGAGRSRGYGFLEYTSHRWALMGLRWLNGHALENGSGKKQRLIVEFAIENAQVVERRKDRESKARIRSKEVLEARERGELPKEKKVLGRDSLMAKTRKGTKGSVGPGKTKSEVRDRKKRPVTKTAGNDTKRGSLSKIMLVQKGDKSNGSPPVSEGRQARRQQIIAKKRQTRRARKKGAAT